MNYFNTSMIIRIIIFTCLIFDSVYQGVCDQKKYNKCLATLSNSFGKKNTAIACLRYVFQEYKFFLSFDENNDVGKFFKILKSNYEPRLALDYNIFCENYGNEQYIISKSEYNKLQHTIEISDDSETQQNLSDDSETQQNLSDDSETQQNLSDDSETQQNLSDDSKTQQNLPVDLETQLQNNYDNCIAQFHKIFDTYDININENDDKPKFIEMLMFENVCVDITLMDEEKNYCSIYRNRLIYQSPFPMKKKLPSINHWCNNKYKKKRKTNTESGSSSNNPTL